MALSVPREAALKVLREIDQNGAYLNLALEEELKKTKMDPRDAGLCTEIVMGTVKNRGYIDNIITNISSIKLKKLSVWILNILRMGIYCIRFLDKIPVSATVNECVKLSRRYGHASSAGYVNAVLRRAAEGGDYTQNLTGNRLLAVKYSFPLWLVEKWAKEQPDIEELLKAMNEEPETFCRLNCTELPEDFEHTDISPYTVIYRGSGGAVRSEAYKNGLVTVQDASSQLAVLALKIERGQKLLDICAAPGGKSAFAAFLGAEVTACDLYEHKIRLIESGASRLKVKIAASVNDAQIFNPEFEEKFDRVLADVPCSGLGILRRKPDIKWSKQAADSGELAAVQKSILNNAAKYLKPGGRLVYSTCTISKAENEGIVKWFLKNHPGFSAADPDIGFPSENGSIQLRPDKHGTDGFFIAAFERIK